MKRDIRFDVCLDAPIPNVIISPNPPISKQSATFNIFGTLDDDVEDNGRLLINFVDQDGNSLGNKSTTLVSPTVAGNPFNITTIVEVPTLTNTYSIEVFIENQN
ncbi:3169_t:CDS:2, partial [Dentiscutata erythropus]